ncbi:MAG: PDZ domain-containing protein [Verrucomicrobiales bacterium]|jgi:C-terminal processing protease CtpA/Prc|nr:PDZ domain-containing protein [Verrucomicrobiales bacterium]
MLRPLFFAVLLTTVTISRADDQIPSNLHLGNSINNTGSIGVLIIIEKSPSASDALTIAKVLPNSPAEKAKLQKGDIITKIDDKPLNKIDFQERVTLLRGNVGTKVELAISRPEPKTEFTVTLERAPLTQFIEPIKDNSSAPANQLER